MAWCAAVLQETRLVYRASRRGDPLLPRPGEHRHHRAPPAPGSLEAVSLGHSAETLRVNASITYWRKPSVYPPRLSVSVALNAPQASRQTC